MANTHCVYFIRRVDGRGAVKIGRSSLKRLSARLSSIQIGNEHELEVVGVLYCEGFRAACCKEVDLHRQFKRFHKRGEWYSPNSDLSLIIRSSQKRIVRVVKSDDIQPEQIKRHCLRRGNRTLDVGYWLGIFVVQDGELYRISPQKKYGGKLAYLGWEWAANYANGFAPNENQDRRHAILKFFGIKDN